MLYSFTGPDGSFPVASLLRDSAGNLYGTTENGGTFGQGVVFRLDPSGKETVLHAFTGDRDGAAPVACLIHDRAGNFYGTTRLGGTDCFPGYQCGVAFKLSTVKETTLFIFDRTPEGRILTEAWLKIRW